MLICYYFSTCILWKIDTWKCAYVCTFALHSAWPKDALRPGSHSLAHTVGSIKLFYICVTEEPKMRPTFAIRFFFFCCLFFYLAVNGDAGDTHWHTCTVHTHGKCRTNHVARFSGRECRPDTSRIVSSPRKQKWKKRNGENFSNFEPPRNLQRNVINDFIQFFFSLSWHFPHHHSKRFRAFCRIIFVAKKKWTNKRKASYRVWLRPTKLRAMFGKMAWNYTVRHLIEPISIDTGALMLRLMWHLCTALRPLCFALHSTGDDKAEKKFPVWWCFWID